MKNSRQKGAAGERELAEFFRELGYTARRTQQYCGSAGDGDIVVNELPTILWESKRVERLNIHEAVHRVAYDAGRTGQIGAVCHRRNGTEWLLTIRLADMHQFAERVHLGMERRGRAKDAPQPESD